MSDHRYSDYSDINVDWITQLPSHWAHIKLKYLAAVRASGIDKHFKDGEEIVYFLGTDTVYSTSEVSKKVELGTASASHTDLKQFCLSKGDLVVTKDSVVPTRIADVSIVAESLNNTICGYHLVLIRPDAESVSSKFLFYTLMSRGANKHLLSIARGTTIIGLSAQSFSNLKLPYPPLNEQTQIARFLDHQTARIDALIAEQQRLIELLKEKRQAVISHAVTKGLDPEVAMKDSGVEWLGEVPVHWETKKLKYLTLKFEQGWSPQCENSPVQDSSEAGVLKVGCVNNGRFRQEENKRLPSELSLDPELTVKAGDLLVSRANTRDLVGSAATPTVDYPNLMISDKLFRLTLDQNSAIPFFLASFLNTPFARRKIEPEATGTSSSMLNIGQSTIREMHVPCPPVGEQISIRDEVVNRTWELMALTERALGLVDLLHERRSALISAAVTGKIDVRDWQPPRSETFPETSINEGATA